MPLIDRFQTFFFYLGFFALSLMTFLSLITDKVGSRAGKVMAVLGFFLLLRYWRVLLKSPLVWLLGLAILSQLLSWGGSQFSHPDWAEDSPKIGRMSVWFLIIPVAFFLQGDLRKIGFVLSLAVLSILISPWVTGNGWQEIIQGINGRRVDFGLNNAQHTAMLFGVALICFGFLTLRQLYKEKISWIKFCFWGCLTTVAVAGVVITQTRAVWLALAVVMVILLIWYVWELIVKEHNYLKACLIAGIVCFLAFIGYQSPLTHTVEKRLSAELSNIEKILQGKDDYIANSSTGIRFTTWTESISWIQEKPLIGWGGNGRDLVVKHSDRLMENNKKIFRHLHNSYLDTLVNYGLLGFSCLIGFFVFLGYGIRKAYKQERIEYGAAVVSSLLLVFWAIVNCFESYMYYSSGSFVITLIGGVVLSVYWKAINFFGNSETGKALVSSTSGLPRES